MTNTSIAAEIAKGTGKGLVGTLLTVATMTIALPMVDRIYQSVKTREGRIAYGVTSAALITSAAAYILA